MPEWKFKFLHCKWSFPNIFAISFMHIFNDFHFFNPLTLFYSRAVENLCQDTYTIFPIYVFHVFLHYTRNVMMIKPLLLQ